MSFKKINTLPTPAKLHHLYPLTQEMAEAKASRDREIKQILTGTSDKLLIIVGPCSADCEDSLLEYTSRLAKLQEAYRERLLLVPRVYSSKPRSNGSGYKGILHQPDPFSPPDLANGISMLRRLHYLVLKETGLSTADEMLYPENYEYVWDLLSYLTVGARSCEDQFHRFAASGSDIACGIKNPTNGSMDALLDSVFASQHPHQFIYRGSVVETEGNPYAHCILRGYTDSSGGSHPNYGFACMDELTDKYAKRNLKCPAVIIDANHANSGKAYLKQRDIILETLEKRKQAPAVYRFLKGFMIESYLYDGCYNQPECSARESSAHMPGLSLTDPCLGWDKTASLLEEIYRMSK